MPQTDSYSQGITYPSLTDGPMNIQTAFAGSIDPLTERSVMRFPSESIRNAQIQTPVAGMMSYIKDSQEFQGFDGTSWQTISATQLPATVVDLGGAYESWSPSFNTLTCRLVGNRVFMDGRIKKISGTIPAGDAINVAHVPVEFAPPGRFAEGQVNLSQSDGPYLTGRCEVRSLSAPTDPGVIQVWLPQSTDWLGFNMSWFLN